jgi:excisionase family DNA binding protein
MDKQCMADEPALSLQALAKRLNVSEKTVRRIVETGKLRAHRIGRQIRVFEADFQNFLSERANREAA